MNEEQIVKKLDDHISDQNWIELKRIFDNCPETHKGAIRNFLDRELTNAISIGMARTANEIAEILQIEIGPKQLTNLKKNAEKSGDIDDYLKALELLKKVPTSDNLGKLMEHQIRLGHFTKARRIVNLRGKNFTIEELKSFLLVFARQKRISYQEQVDMSYSGYEELVTFLNETESRPVR